MENNQFKIFFLIGIALLIITLIFSITIIISKRNVNEGVSNQQTNNVVTSSYKVQFLQKQIGARMIYGQLGKKNQEFNVDFTFNITNTGISDITIDYQDLKITDQKGNVYVPVKNNNPDTGTLQLTAGSSSQLKLTYLLPQGINTVSYATDNTNTRGTIDVSI